MKKRFSEGLPLGDALREFLKENRLEHGMDKVEVRKAWGELMGNGVNKYTTGVELRGGTLVVLLSSSVLREELSHGKTKIIAMLNEELGKEVVKKLELR